MKLRNSNMLSLRRESTILRTSPDEFTAKFTYKKGLKPFSAIVTYTEYYALFDEILTVWRRVRIPPP
jgi:hypothetical protein